MFYINEIISRNQRERERDASLKIMSNISPSLVFLNPTPPLPILLPLNKKK